MPPITMMTRKMIEPRIVKFRFSGRHLASGAARRCSRRGRTSAADSPNDDGLGDGDVDAHHRGGGRVVAHGDHRPADAALHQVAHQDVAEAERARARPSTATRPGPARPASRPVQAGGVVAEAVDARGAAGEVVELADERGEDLGEGERDEREVEALEAQGGDADEHADDEADQRRRPGGPARATSRGRRRGWRACRRRSRRTPSARSRSAR